MTTKYITMSASQTERYDEDDPGVLFELRKVAKEIRRDGETVEIYTDDGILADVVQD